MHLLVYTFSSFGMKSFSVKTTNWNENLIVYKEFCVSIEFRISTLTLISEMHPLIGYHLVMVTQLEPVIVPFFNQYLIRIIPRLQKKTVLDEVFIKYIVMVIFA